MRKIPAALLLVLLTVFVSCEPETMLTVDQTSLSFTDTGGSQSITLTANKVWSASSNQSWCKVSPYAGEEATGSRISISCEANTTYDSRSCIIMIQCAERTTAISVNQETNKGFILSQDIFELDSNEQIITVKIQTNTSVHYEIDADWISFVKTKGLSSSTLSFLINKNTSYENRLSYIRFIVDGSGKEERIVVKQSGSAAIIIDSDHYEIGYNGGSLPIKVQANIEYECIIDDTADNWIKVINTKTLQTSEIVLSISENRLMDSRSGGVTFQNERENISYHITIDQKEHPIVFPDVNFNQYVIEEYDLNRNGSIEKEEALLVKKINVERRSIKSLDGVEFFPNLEYLRCSYNDITEIDVSLNERLVDLICEYLHLNKLDVSHNKALWRIWCWHNQLESIDVSNNPNLRVLDVSENKITHLDISNNPILERLSCYGNSISSLDLSHQTLLRKLYCRRNRISSLNMNTNPLLDTLVCDNNRLSSLSISNCANITYLDCGENELMDLTLGSKRLQKVWVDGNNLSLLDCRLSKGIQYIDCTDNVNLRALYATDDFKKILKDNHTVLFLEDKWGETTVDKIIPLEDENLRYYLEVTNGRVFNSMSMEVSMCEVGYLKSLTIKQYSPNEQANQAYKEVQKRGNIHSLKGIEHWDGLDSISIDGLQVSSVDLSGCSNLSYFYAQNCGINNLVLNTMLKHLDISNPDPDWLVSYEGSPNAISMLNTSICANLESLIVFRNQLSEIDVSANKNLRYLSLGRNLLHQIDVTNNLDLVMLSCTNNRLQTLDVSNNLKLNELHCGGNPDLSVIWLKEGQIIPFLYYNTAVSTVKYR